MLVKAQTVFELTLGRYTAHAAHAKTKIKIIKRTKLLGNCLILLSFAFLTSRARMACQYRNYISGEHTLNFNFDNVHTCVANARQEQAKGYAAHRHVAIDLDRFRQLVSRITSC